jgi:hypothetical protein
VRLLQPPPLCFAHDLALQPSDPPVSCRAWIWGYMQSNQQIEGMQVSRVVERSSEP